MLPVGFAVILVISTAVQATEQVPNISQLLLTIVIPVPPQEPPPVKVALFGFTVDGPCAPPSTQKLILATTGGVAVEFILDPVPPAGLFTHTTPEPPPLEEPQP